jgi:hypothetical protein
LVDYEPLAWERIEAEGLGGFTGVTPLLTLKSRPATPPSSDSQARETPIGTVDKGEWYVTDVKFAGKEMRRWAGVKYESQGGQELGRMVRALWDERGWECLWVSAQQDGAQMRRLMAWIPVCEPTGMSVRGGPFLAASFV